MSTIEACCRSRCPCEPPSVKDFSTRGRSRPAICSRLLSIRFDGWKAVYCEQKKPGGFEVWMEPLTCYRAPKLFNLPMDPHERADVVSDQYYDWVVKNDYLLFKATMEAGAFLQTFLDYPPSQESVSFTIDQIARDADAKIKMNRAKVDAPN